MRKPYDPKLREAAEEFKALCKKYDCIGSTLFVSPTHSEFVNIVTASWSVMKLEDEDENGYTLRFRSKKEDFPSREAQNAATEASAHAVTSLMQWGKKIHIEWSTVLQSIQKHAKVFYTAWDHTPDSVPGDGL